MDSVIDRLLKSDEPSVRYKVLVNVSEKKKDSSEIKKFQQGIKTSKRVKTLLSERGKDGEIPYHPYKKWYGAHWVLSCLADLGHPSGDRSLIPLREQVYQWLFSEKHQKSIKTIQGRVRRCASQEGNALWYLLSLGLADSQTDELAHRLIKWQWPDGGWNCDKNPEAFNSSFHESLIPLRSLSLYAKLTNNKEAKKAALKASEIFLKRKMFKRQRDDKIISDDFIRFHYPCYWHYDMLFGLKVMAEADFIRDKRCKEALDLLESKRLPDGGFPAEKKYYRVADKETSGRSLVDWGVTSKRRMNEFVTTDALYVLKETGRLKL